MEPCRKPERQKAKTRGEPFQELAKFRATGPRVVAQP